MGNKKSTASKPSKKKAQGGSKNKKGTAGKSKGFFGWLKAHNIFSAKFYKKHGSAKSRLVKFATSLITTALVVVSTFFILLNVYGKKYGINSFGDLVTLYRTYNENRDTTQRTDTELGVDSEADKIYTDAGVTNIMLYGIDSRSKDEESRSDAIMLLTIDKGNHKIKMTSIARDTYVTIPFEHSTMKDKVNHAFVYGWHYSDKATRKEKISDGAALSIKTINTNLGLNVRDYITIDFWTLADLVDYVGGVTIDVDERERRDMNWRLIPHIQSMGISCERISSAGVQTLSGGQALAYCRERYIDGDVQRGARQREVLMALFEKAKTIDTTKYAGLIQLILENCTTTLDFDDLWDHGQWAIGNASNIKFENLGLPTEELDTGGSWINGVWYYTYDLERAKQIIQQFILETTPTAEGGTPNG